MKVDIAKETECGSIHIAIEYNSEYRASYIRGLWEQVSTHANRILLSLEAQEKKEHDTSDN